MDKNAVLQSLDKDFQKALSDLIRLVKIPSVSFPGYPAEVLKKNAEEVRRFFLECGFEQSELIEVDGAPPYVFAETPADDGSPVLLMYAHYDVQPPLRDTKWASPAFDPQIRDGRLFGRGAADDKAGIVLIASAVKACLKNKSLPVHIKVIIEGEEEVGSPNLKKLLSKYKDKLSCDAMLLADLSNYDTGTPALTVSLRGLAALDVEVTALKNVLHSGMWGGPLPDAATALCKMIAALTDEKGVAKIDTGCKEGADSKLLAQWKELAMTDTEFRRQAGLTEGAELFAHNEFIFDRLWMRSCLAVNILEAGRRGETGNVLMNSAFARIGLRLPPGADAETALRNLKNALTKACPWGLIPVFSNEACFPAWKTDQNHPLLKEALLSLEEGYGAKAHFIGCGGSVPFAGEMSAGLGGVPAIMLGVEDPPSNAHGENESLHLGDWLSAMKSTVHFFFRMQKYFSQK